MSKSLTEVAKAVLMKEEAANMASQKPNGGIRQGAEANPMSNDAQAVGDAPKKPGEGSNVGAAASASIKKDTSKAAQSNVAAEKPKKQAEVMEEDSELEGEVVSEEEINEDDIELSEELTQFIDAMVAEGATEEEIAQAIDENFEFVTEGSEEVSEESVLENYEVDMSEDIAALFAGEELSEEFKEKAKTIFEAAVKSKLEEELAVLEEAYAATLEEQVAAINESLTENVDDYLNYVVEQWVSDNEVAIESGLRTELMEDFVSGMRNLFAEHYIDVPEEKVSVVEEMASKLEEIESKLNEEIQRNVALNKMLNEAHVNDALDAACDGLTATQAEKLKSLAEGIEYSDASEYAQKVMTLRESYFTNAVKTDNVLDSVEVSDGKSMIAEDLSGPMANYVKALGRTLSK